ncbi:hypothetical protein EVAR_81425_1 [Eumeta japonica]|uniref:Uncharacterized protein n=1 Tax=Eumeta variegata TaxID=151549 RepID=A0A4C1W1Q8_EUMVA|nr:hypothetical protein EVAR_81425_1 [Eumeta japonica]
MNIHESSVLYNDFYETAKCETGACAGPMDEPSLNSDIEVTHTTRSICADGDAAAASTQNPSYCDTTSSWVSLRRGPMKISTVLGPCDRQTRPAALTSLSVHLVEDVPRCVVQYLVAIR